MNPYSYNADSMFIKKEKEKRILRSAGNRTALSFLVMSFIMVFWSRPLLYISRIFGFEQSFRNFVKDDTLSNIVQIVVSMLAFTLCIVVMAKLFDYNVNEGLKIKRVKDKKEAFSFFLIGIGICIFLDVMILLSSKIFISLGIHYQANIHSTLPTNVFGVILTVISTAVLPAIIEEFAIRGVVLNVLKRYGEVFALVVSSVFFGLMHGNLDQIPFTLMLGFYLGFITLKTNSILPAVALHFTNNLLSTVSDYLRAFSAASAKPFVIPVYFLILLIPCFFGIYMLRDKKHDYFKFAKKKCSLSEKEKFDAFLLSPLMIAVYFVVFWESFFVYV